MGASWLPGAFVRVLGNTLAREALGPTLDSCLGGRGLGALSRDFLCCLLGECVVVPAMGCLSSVLRRATGCLGLGALSACF